MSDYTYEHVRFETTAWPDAEGYHEFYKGRRSRILALDGTDLNPNGLNIGYGFEILEMDVTPPFAPPEAAPYWANV